MTELELIFGGVERTDSTGTKWSCGDGVCSAYDGLISMREIDVAW